MQPDERTVESAIAAAFDRLPDPSAARLGSLEARLVRAVSRAPKRERSRWFYGWLIFGLTATAAATWWAGEILVGESSREPSNPAAHESIERRDGVAPAPTPGSPERPTGKTAPNESTNSPTIYRREAY